MEREINIYKDNFIQNENGPQFNVAKLMRKSSFSRIGFDEKNYDLLSKSFISLFRYLFRIRIVLFTKFLVSTG